MRAKSSGAHAIRIPVSEGYKQKEATATRFCLPCACQGHLSIGDRLPHHLGPLDNQLRRPAFL